MRRTLLLGYQVVSGLSDTVTGVLLILVPAWTLRLMGVRLGKEAHASTLIFVSYVGVFVLSTGIACLYGALLLRPVLNVPKLETVWLLTGLTRALVALFVIAAIAQGHLASAWASVAFTDGIFAAVQGVGLAKGWLRHAAG